MLTVKIIAGCKELILEALKCNVGWEYADSLEQWDDIVSGTGGDVSVINAPPKNCKDSPIPFKEMSIQAPSGEWTSYFVYNSSIYVMNEQGQTIATYYH